MPATTATPADSFRDYVHARVGALARTAFLLTGDWHLAEDLVQQTLTKVAARWEQIVAAGNPDPYVRRVLYHQHVSWWRRWRREPVPVAAVPEVAGADPHALTATAIAVRQALARLTPKQRAVLVLRYFEDLTETQTAQVLGVSTGTVKSQTRDALARLRTVAPELADLQEASR
ncbi:MAG: SigE family RNA polymerase sigma factor [Hamadaea sp.]|uniref:SigE family RNA polymerase sigma factor n=1 Tax=Hamadaea sp. TaxID=2024425 RepID=UPI0017D5F670|nr:SigE family RNA polymerase sigma factor [Hamadaea sp.]NUR69532.1 SigE family RNA polymerase sigma factor [Hamadaea sp.]NUT20768.1 SigE family RNA polymerase sigma factor [Hamadaea sp.]